ncbi:papain like protease [Flavobacterium araucananum]|uniref:Peptidase C1A papain C-terminal domain-containing protein n=1 Tax=Flavobacterium araucananum TaxID=946678 RepID=A0A227NTZ7_9FLAO|nr:C1 family peptidase [Flavobacterium araucananum]OXG00813.1 hypothetical protein B0A64_19510 [Flavobacterium araucananum]PWK03283.1 papain like protease [Flavobacterium araucananum]
MKKTFLKLAGVLCVTLLLHSCQKDELPQNGETNSTLNQGRAMGYIPSTPDQLAEIKELNAFSYYNKESLPAKYVLPELPVALNQGYKGSCVAYSIAHARTLLNKESKTLANGSPNYEAYASADYLYEKYKFNKNSCDNGVFFIEALDALKTEGTPSYADMGLVNCGVLPTASQEKNAKKNRVNDYYRLPSETGKPILEDIKRQIANGNPVIIGIKVDYDFGSNSIRLWDKNSSGFYGNHAVVLTGYDDEKQAFRLLNSWGSSWGENGYIWATYRKIQEAISPDAYVLETDNLLSYKGGSMCFVYLVKNKNNEADNITFSVDQLAAFMNNGELNWSNNLVKPYYEQYNNPTLDINYYTPNNDGLDVDGDLTFEVRLRIESSKNTSYPIDTEKGVELKLWNGAYGGKDQSISCNVPMSGTAKESVFKNNLGETYKYIAYNYLSNGFGDNVFSEDKTIRFRVKNGQFYLTGMYSNSKLPSGINRLRTFGIKLVGTIGSISDVRVYKNGKQIGIDSFDGTIAATQIRPWMQWFE